MPLYFPYIDDAHNGKNYLLVTSFLLLPCNWLADDNHFRCVCVYTIEYVWNTCVKKFLVPIANEWDKYCVCFVSVVQGTVCVFSGLISIFLFCMFKQFKTDFANQDQKLIGNLFYILTLGCNVFPTNGQLFLVTCMLHRNLKLTSI